MVSGPNLNETSIVSGGYGGPAGGIIPTSSIKGIVKNPEFPQETFCFPLILYSCSFFWKDIIYLLLSVLNYSAVPGNWAN